MALGHQVLRIEAYIGAVAVRCIGPLSWSQFASFHMAPCSLRASPRDGFAFPLGRPLRPILLAWRDPAAWGVLIHAAVMASE